MKELEIEEEKSRRKREDDIKSEVVVPGIEKEKLESYSENLPETVEREENKIKVEKRFTLVAHHFQSPEKIIEKRSMKEVHFDIESSSIRIDIPYLNFKEKLDLLLKELRKELVNFPSSMYELDNIPELNFEISKEIVALKITTSFSEKLEILSFESLNILSVPEVSSYNRDQIVEKKHLKDFPSVRDSTSTPSDSGAPSTEVLDSKLDINFDPINFVFGAMIRFPIDRPMIILAREPKNKRFEYIEFLKRILREIYRIHGSGLPIPAHNETPNFNEIKREIRADRHIWVLNLNNIKLERDKEIGYLIDRLRELYSQNLGFVVLYGNDEKIEKVKDILKIDSPLPSYVEFNIIEDESVFKLAQLMWGFKENFPISGNSLDSTVVRLEESYYREIEKLVEDLDTLVTVEPSGEDEEGINGESILHYALKAFVVKYLNKNRLNEMSILTEYSFDKGILDVYVPNSNLAVEIETLYGTKIPMLKLRKKIDSRLDKGFKLHIIVPNPQLLIYLKDIRKLRKFYREKYGDRIEFFAIDFDSGEIIPITTFLESLSHIIKAGE